MPTLESAGQAASGQEAPAATEPEEPGAEGGPVAPDGGPDGAPNAGPGGEAELAIADVSAVERDGRLGFPVSLSRASATPVTVAYASEDGTARAGSDYVTVTGTLTFAGQSAETKEIEVRVLDDAEHEARETFTLRLSGAEGARLTVAAATGTIVDDDRRAVAVYPEELNVEEGGEGSYTVVLGTRPAGPVTVTVEERGELTAAPRQVEFAAAEWHTGRTVTVTAAEDDDAVGDAPVELALVASGGGYDGVRAAVRVTIVENDVTTLAAGAGRAVEGEGRIGFEVSVSLTSDQVVTVDYATADGTADAPAEAGADYTAVSGTLTFPAGSRQARTVEVVVRDDSLDEADEEFTLRLSNAVHAQLVGGGASTTARATITDDDPPPHLSIAAATVTESGGAIGFAVRLDPASGRTVTVDYASADGTATAGTDYTAVSGTLTFAAGATTRTIAVPIVDDQDSEETETFTVTLRDPRGATLTYDTATGAITDDGDDETVEELALSSLQVTGGGTMYPAFDPAIHHYAVACSNATTLQVTATASRGGATLTLLRADPADNLQSTGTLDMQATVNDDHDVVIALSDGGETTMSTTTTDTTMYIVHCWPQDFPDTRILNRLDGASDGLLFVAPRPGFGFGIAALIDYHGVPRFIRSSPENFRPIPDGPTIDGRQVKHGAHTKLFDEDFELIRTVNVVAPLNRADFHDFLVTDRGFLLMSYHVTTRDLSAYQDADGEPLPTEAKIMDSVIQEVAPDGTELFRWNSWDHLAVETDCLLIEKYLDSRIEYAHLNSLQIVDGDIIASFRGCAQVVRIDRSSGTGAVEWKLGGTATTRDPSTTYLPLVGDPAGEFCGQHQATLTASGTVVLFDNGVQCLGPRKHLIPFTRVVEYDISSGTQAEFLREYRRPTSQGGYTWAEGGVTVLNDDLDRNNDRWLIAWGIPVAAIVGGRDLIAISEVDPVTGTSLFDLSMYRGSAANWTYRVYHQPESAVTIPLNLP